METQKSASTNLFSPFPKQKIFQDAVLSGKYRVLGYGGAMGGGKTFVTLATLIALHKIYPGSKSVVIRESLPVLKKTTIPSFGKVVPKNFIEKYNQQDQTVYFKNGSQMIFMAEDYSHDKDLDKFKGLEVNFAFLEQIEELQKVTFDMMLIRTGRNKIVSNPPPMIFYTVNPTLTWVKKEFHEKAESGLLPEDHFYLRATIFDNPVLAEDEGYMKQLKALDELTYRRHINGDWSAFAVNNPFAYAFKRHEHVKRGIDWNRHLEVLLGFDFNVDPITCVSAQQENGVLRFPKVFRLENSNIYELCNQIRAYYPTAVFKITGDATGQGRSALAQGNINYYDIIKQELNLSWNQMHQPTVNPSVADTRVLLNSMLQNYTMEFDEAGCSYLIDDLETVEVDEKGDIMKQKAEAQKRGHLLDGLRYICNTFFSWFLKAPEA